MKFITSKLQTFVLVFTILLSIKHYNSQSIGDLITPKCNSNSISYTILANLSEYLENEKNIDGREIYKTINDLKSKKVGITKDIYYNESIFTFDSLNKSYDTYESLIEDLRHYKLDAIIAYTSNADHTQMYTNDLSTFQDLQIQNSSYGVQKGNITLLNELNDVLGNETYIEELEYKWLGVNYQIKYIDKDLTGNNGKLNIVVKPDDLVNCYKDGSGELLGPDIEILYEFARKNGYQLNFIEVNTYDEQVDFLKNKSADIAVGNFIVRDDKKNEVEFSDPLHPSPIVIIVRYENLNDSVTWTQNYNSIDDFDGDTLGILSDSAFINLTIDNFPNSDYIYHDNIFSLFHILLLESIDGFLIDGPIADHFKLLYPERLDYYNTDLYDYEYAFAFKKNDEKGTALLNEFNQFLSNINITELYIKWNVTNTTNVKIDKTLNTSAPTINAAFYMDLKPLSFKERDETKGFEIELLYRFAREKNYNLNLEQVDLKDRINYLQEDKANITGGWFVITDERKQLVDFSKPVYEGKTALAVRIDCKVDSLTLKILDDNSYVKANNTANIQVRFPNATKTSYCVFPDKYNETILINCTINDLTNINPYSEGFTFNGTSEKMQIVYANLELDNFLQANSKITGHNNIITESNKSSIVCYSSIDTSVTTTNTTISYDNSTSSNTTLYRNHGSSGGISTGAIIGIAIPCILLALGGLGAAFAFKSSATPALVYGGQESIQNMRIQYPNPNDYYITHNIPNNNVIITANNVPNNNIIIPDNNINIANKDVINAAQ